MQNYQKPTQGLFSAILGLMALMFGSVNALGQLRDAMNSIWKVKKEQIQERATPVKYLLYFAVTGCVILLLLLSVAFSSALRLVSTNMEGHITTQIQVYKVLNLAGFGSILLLLCLLLYRLLPDLRLKWRSLFFGALLAAVLFSFGKEAFVLYVTRTGIGSAYGALSSIMIFLIWMYLSTQVILLGAAFAYACEYRKDGS
ncbi:MAG: YihY/virulence factor BrkB family protein [Desulfohalobiaceae bacterium]|nr:YihY/virulence factor BrkB family protein [Desulfohalobiaceae bacterium]